MAIIPDFNRLLGVHRDYSLKGEDYDQVGSAVQKDYQLSLETVRKVALESRETKTLGSGKKP